MDIQESRIVSALYAAAEALERADRALEDAGRICAEGLRPEFDALWDLKVFPADLKFVLAAKVTAIADAWQEQLDAEGA